MVNVRPLICLMPAASAFKRTLLKAQTCLMVCKKCHFCVRVLWNLQRSELSLRVTLLCCALKGGCVAHLCCALCACACARACVCMRVCVWLRGVMVCHSELASVWHPPGTHCCLPSARHLAHVPKIRINNHRCQSWFNHNKSPFFLGGGPAGWPICPES